MEFIKIDSFRFNAENNFIMSNKLSLKKKSAWDKSLKNGTNGDYRFQWMVWQYEKVDDDENQYALLWEHHVVVEKLTAKNNYSSIIYLEDDTHLPWSHIES